MSTTPGSSPPPHLFPLLHVYNTFFHGLSTSLHPDRAAEIACHPAILAFFKDRRPHHPLPQFLGLRIQVDLWSDSNYGSDVIFGVLDTSIWPECRSFSNHNLNPVPFPIPRSVNTSSRPDLADHLCLALDLACKATASPRWNVYRSMQLARKMEKLDRWIAHWLKRQMPAHVLADVHHLRVEFAVHLDRIECHIQKGTPMMRPATVGVMEVMEGLEFGGGGGEAPPPVGAVVRARKERVREMLMATGGDAEVVGICGIGGSGKTTLAKEICRVHRI